MPARYRIGAVKYLNARPLIWGLEASSPCRVTPDLPSALAQGLAAGEYDVALVPVASYLLGVGRAAVAGVSISSPGPVGTVKLFARCPLDEVQTLALDRGSRTSALLVRAALSSLYGVRPRCVEYDPGPSGMPAEADAALVIGHDYLLAGVSPPEATVTVDVGELWSSWQGLPFVAALWVLRTGRCPPKLGRTLREARDAGLAAVDEIAATEAAARGLTRDTVFRYFTEMLDFSLGPEQLRSIERYRDLLVEERLLPNARELEISE